MEGWSKPEGKWTLFSLLNSIRGISFLGPSGDPPPLENSFVKWPHIKGICLNCVWQYTKSAHVAFIFLLMNFLSLKKKKNKTT